MDWKDILTKLEIETKSPSEEMRLILGENGSPRESLKFELIQRAKKSGTWYFWINPLVDSDEDQATQATKMAAAK